MAGRYVPPVARMQLLVLSKARFQALVLAV